MISVIIQKGDRGPHVARLKRAMNKRRDARNLSPIKASDTMGTPSWEAWEETYEALGGKPGTFSGGWTRAYRRYRFVRFPGTRGALARSRAKTWKATRGTDSLKRRALREGESLIGVMEQGGNNRGAEVEKIIRSGGGKVGDAWCGWLNAHCYKTAGSTAVTWHWGAVRLYLPLPGLRRTSTPEAGDIVRFTFDHTGMFVRDLGNGYIETIEGNTGATGARSDSITGGDGVYRKSRHKSLVRDYIEVTR